MACLAVLMKGSCPFLSYLIWVLRSIHLATEILLDRLSFSLTFGIHGTAHKWFTSYPLNRTQFVVLNDVASSSLSLLYGVPQGFVLGPIFSHCTLGQWPILSTTTVSKLLKVCRRHPDTQCLPQISFVLWSLMLNPVLSHSVDNPKQT